MLLPGFWVRKFFEWLAKQVKPVPVDKSHFIPQGKETYDHKTFFDAVRLSPFPGKLIQQQVDGMGHLLKCWEGSTYTDRRWLAYVLATALAETGVMLPVEEADKGRGRPYGVPDPTTGQIYYGRGLVQLTWKANYERATNELNSRNLVGRKVDLVNHPEQALEPDISCAILFHGMAEGWFTKHKLPDHFNNQKADWVNARKIVNGLDRADEIARNAKAFDSALALASKQTTQPQKPPIPSDLAKAELIARLKQKTGARHIAIVY